MIYERMNTSRYLLSSLFCAIVILTWSSEAMAQVVEFEHASENSPVLTVDGKSTLHDWTMTADVVTDYPAELSVDPHVGGEIENFSFKVEVASMKSGRSSTMDTKTHKALKSVDHPYISYIQKTPALLEAGSGDGLFTLKSSGSLTIAGVENEVVIDVNVSYMDGELVFNASYPMKMSAYNVERPEAMFGQIKTKDDITINLQFVYKEK
jgi:hypothetical protein